ncbi:hypothetical protein GZH53_10825 [Flavihumibacter sp. R14]|nr:hypothetical protein [Flavihumibacter soli]
MNIKNSFKNQIIALSLLTSVALLFSQCKKDNLEETQLDTLQSSELVAETLSDAAVAATGITSDSYYLVNSLPAGYVKDGSKDYTSYVQAAITKYSNIVFPAFPILINDNGLRIGSNKTISFPEGSEVRLKGTSSSGYYMLNIYDATNVTLYNPVVVGDRNSHIGTSGEFGIGIGIRGSSNITIYSPKVSNCWGDGIYIGQAVDKSICKNIVIKDAYLRKNRRDGISIIAVDGLLLDNIYAGYTDGTKPMTGINFEPNNPECELKNIRINNPVTEFNGSNGIQVTAHHMLGSINKNVDITIVNHKDVGSPRFATKWSCRPTDGHTAKMYGKLRLVNPTWHKTATETNQPLYLSSDQSNFIVEVSSPEIMNTSGSILSYSATSSLLMKMASSGFLKVSEVADPAFSTPIVSAPAPSAPSTTGSVVFAVNAGGSSFKASNGITYAADKNFSKGYVYKSTNAITNTSDDALYQSERYGNFSYAVPVANGTYEVTFKMSELYHKASGKRRFDILAENNEIVSNLDMYATAGVNNAHDIVKTVSVTDGTLNLTFRTDIDNAKVSAFHVIKK